MEGKCIYEEQGCNKIKEKCRRESCAYAAYFDFLTDNFGKDNKVSKEG